MVSRDDSPHVRFTTFAVAALIWLLAAYLTSSLIAHWPTWFAMGAVLLFSLPIAIANLYLSVSRQTRRVTFFKPGGWGFWVMSGRLFKTIFWVTASWGMSFLMLMNFWSYSTKEWVLLAIVAPAFWVVHTASYRLLRGELNRPDMAASFALHATQWICAAITLLMFAALIFIWGGGVEHASLSSTIETSRSRLKGNTPDSSLVALGLQAGTLLDAVKSYLIQGAGKLDSHLSMILGVSGGLLVFWSACLSLSCFSIPRAEFRRVFGPISPDIGCPPLSKLRIAGISAIATFVVLFIYTPTFARLEQYLKEHPAAFDAIKDIQIAAESIDGRLYKPGTIAQIQEVRVAALKQYETSNRAITQMIRSGIESAFSKAEGNVDTYLDWYYSLPAEYVRIWKMVTGELEDYLATELTKHLNAGVDLAAVKSGYEALKALNPELQSTIRNRTKEILAGNMLTDTTSSAKVEATASLDSLLSIPSFADRISFENRVGAGVVGAGIGGVVTAVIVKKGIVKMAAKALAKVVAAKAGGAGIGAVIGGVLGSFIPGPGTVAGGAIGGVVTGVLVDALALKLEESLDRKAFKEQIVTEIRAARTTALNW